MHRHSAAMLILLATAVCLAQETMVASHPATSRHFRLTFVLTAPQSHQPPQSFQLDVPVRAGATGMADLNTTTGLTGQVEGSIQQSLECTNVHPSANGLSANVSFSAETVLEPMAGSNEPIHRKFMFKKQIDVALEKSTEITDESHLVPLGDAAKAAHDGGALRPVSISVTATEI